MLMESSRASRLVIKSMLRSYRERSNQFFIFFISTHSLELMEMLIDEAENLGLGDEDLKIYRLRLVDGVLQSEEYALSEASTAIKKLEWGLRM